MPLVRAAEYPPDYKALDPGARPDAHSEGQAWSHIYNNRWKPVATALRKFDAQALEAEALWGTGIRKDAERIRACAYSLFVAMEEMVRDKLEGGRAFESDRSFGKRMRADVYASPNATDNELSNEIAKAVTEIETKMRAHLSRGDIGAEQ
jgi:hypothetical protein